MQSEKRWGLLCITLFLICSQIPNMPHMVSGVLCGLGLALTVWACMPVSRRSAFRAWKQRIVKRS